MTLNGLERDFLERLSVEPWASPPLFDHSLIARLVEAGFVETRALPSNSIRYEVTMAGRAAVADI
jgi:DNA-binding PadR family transcriptional regulator